VGKSRLTYEFSGQRHHLGSSNPSAIAQLG
jgi:hypothetical protein